MDALGKSTNASNDIDMKINFKQDGKRVVKHPMSAVTKKSETAPQRKPSFQTSLDPEFLALFAS